MRRLACALVACLCLSAGEAGAAAGRLPTLDMSHGSCKGSSGTRMFGRAPVTMSDVGTVQPMGLMIGGHVTPIDHMYFYPASDTREMPVYAIADQTLVEVGTRDRGGNQVDYRLVFEHSCTFWSYFDLVTRMSPSILKTMGWTNTTRGYKGIRIRLKKGSLIGWVKGQSLDFGVYNARLHLQGFVRQTDYATESWKPHTDDPFKYFPPSVVESINAKNVRIARPRAGRIDWDLDGRLRGNWFREGTNYYAGRCRAPCSYWAGHLAFAPDALDPAHVIVSVGDWRGEASQFAVLGNGPDPSTVSIASGVVRYELVAWEYRTAAGESWDRHSFVSGGVTAHNMDDVQGVVLVQLLGARRLKMEQFPGKTATEVNRFTSAARIYVR